MPRMLSDSELDVLDAQQQQIEALKFQLKLGLTTVDNLMVSIEDLVPEDQEVPQAYKHAVFWTGDADTLIKG